MSLFIQLYFLVRSVQPSRFARDLRTFALLLLATIWYSKAIRITCNSKAYVIAKLLSLPSSPLQSRTTYLVSREFHPSLENCLPI